MVSNRIEECYLQEKLILLTLHFVQYIEIRKFEQLKRFDKIRKFERLKRFDKIENLINFTLCPMHKDKKIWNTKTTLLDEFYYHI